MRGANRTLAGAVTANGGAAVVAGTGRGQRRRHPGHRQRRHGRDLGDALQRRHHGFDRRRGGHRRRRHARQHPPRRQRASPTGTLTTTGGANGAGGAISVNASGAVNVGVVTTSGGAANAGTSGTNAGNVDLLGQSVTTTTITADGIVGNGADRPGGNGGNVAVTATGGAVAVGAISAVGAAGTATNASGGQAGAITLDAGGASPTITLNGNLTARGGDRAGSGTAGSGADDHRQGPGAARVPRSSSMRAAATPAWRAAASSASKAASIRPAPRER